MFARTRICTIPLAIAVVFTILLGAPAQASTKPSAPTGLTSKVTPDSATLSWTKSANATAYSVCLMTSGTSTTCVRTSAKHTSPPIMFSNLAPTGGTDYYWTVTAYNGTSSTTSSKARFDLAAVTTATTRPSSPTGIKLAVSTSGVKVTWTAAANAKTYRVCLLSSATSTACEHLSASSSLTSATFTGLVPTTGTDWYARVHAYNGAVFAFSSKYPFDLPVGAVTGLKLGAVTTTSLNPSWSAATNAGKYQIQWAENSAMTTNLKKFTTTSTSHPLTGLTPGKTYYIRVRGTNDAILGAFATAPAQKLPTDPFSMIAVTYNLCGQDKCVTSANHMKTWSTRKPIAGALARDSGGDIIATQESHAKDTNFITQLPGYNVAAYYSAKTLFYRTAKLSKLRSGVITLDSTRKKYAVWAALQDRVTKTVVFVVDAHLQPYKGKTIDDIRKKQTQVLLAGVAKANTAHLPVVYAGDFNSNKSNADQTRYPGGYDAPYQVFTAAGIDDSYDTATMWLNKDWNSSNQAKNPPVRHYDHIDHIFVDPTITIQRWQTMIRTVMTTVNGTSVPYYKTPFATDHNPVRVVLTVPGTH